MTRHSVFRKTFIALALMQLALIIVPAREARAQTEPKLHWLDSSGELVELDWPASLQWVWDDASAAAQVWIEIPEQLNLSIEETSQLKLLKSTAAKDGAHQLLVVNMRSPKITAQLTKQDPDTAAQKVGLVVDLAPVGDSPKIMVSESCAKEGVSLQQKRAGASFLFIAASCRPTAKFLEVTLTASEDAFLADDFGKPLSSEPEPLILKIPKKQWKNLRPGSSLGFANVAMASDPANTAQFEVVYRKTQLAPTASSRPAPRKQAVLPPSTPLQAQTGTWSLALDAGLAYFAYTVPTGTSGVPASADNIVLAARAEHELLKLGVPIEVGASLPLITFAPAFFHFPVSGFYEVEAALPLQATSGAGVRLRFAPGLKMGFIELEKRPGGSGFYVGPQLAADLSGKIGALGDRAFEARAGVAPLGGRGFSPLFHSVDVSADLSLEAIKGGAERRWDLVFKLDYLNLASPGNQAADVIATSLGVRTWY